MITSIADLFPVHAMVVMIVVGLLILKVDKERMSRSELSRETHFSGVLGWIYVVGGAASGLIGLVLAIMFR